MSINTPKNNSDSLDAQIERAYGFVSDYFSKNALVNRPKIPNTLRLSNDSFMKVDDWKGKANSADLYTIRSSYPKIRATEVIRQAIRNKGSFTMVTGLFPDSISVKFSIVETSRGQFIDHPYDDSDVESTRRSMAEQFGLGVGYPHERNPK